MVKNHTKCRRLLPGILRKRSRAAKDQRCQAAAVLLSQDGDVPCAAAPRQSEFGMFLFYPFPARCQGRAIAIPAGAGSHARRTVGSFPDFPLGSAAAFPVFSPAIPCFQSLKFPVLRSALSCRCPESRGNPGHTPSATGRHFQKFPVLSLFFACKRATPAAASAQTNRAAHRPPRVKDVRSACRKTFRDLGGRSTHPE